DCAEGVKRVVEGGVASKGAEREYRIGVWRVLARAAPGGRERDEWIRKIVAAFLDVNGPDRLHAAESAAKLGYRARGSEADAFELVARTLPGPLAANARWVLANSGRPDGEARLMELLESDDRVTRADAAYAPRHPPPLSPAAGEKVPAAVGREPATEVVRASLLSAAFVHAPASQKAQLKRELLKYARTGTSDEIFEACAALATEGQEDDVTLL